MTQKTALSIVIPVVEKAVAMMAFANQTPKQKAKYRRLKQAVAVLKEQNQC